MYCHIGTKRTFSVKDSKGKTTRYVYPNAFEYGTVKLHKKKNISKEKKPPHDFNHEVVFCF